MHRVIATLFLAQYSELPQSTDVGDCRTVSPRERYGQYIPVIVQVDGETGKRLPLPRAKGVGNTF